MPDALRKLSECDFPMVRSWLKLPDPACAILDACVSAATGFDRLEQAGFLIEAAELAAYALPKREAVWWACLCADDTAPVDLPAADRSARQEAERWVREPTDMVRRDAMKVAEAAGFKTAETWAAVAAFWSEGSLAPAGKPVLGPAPRLTGKAVTVAIRLSVARGDSADESALLRSVLRRARTIAAGAAGRSAEETFTTGRVAANPVSRPLAADETVPAGRMADKSLRAARLTAE
jgi:hypothetical protein